MAGIFSINNRIKIGFAFAIVFLLVIATNRLDKKRYNTIENSLTSVYEDRLVAKGYIYELNNIFHDLEKALLIDAKFSNNQGYNVKVKDLIEAYQNTKLTNSEKSTFNNFKTDFKELQDLEKSFFEATDARPNETMVKKIASQLNRIQNDLDKLAIIQLEEGKSLTKFAKNSLDNSDIMSKIEIGIIIFIGIFVQYIIFKK